MAAAAPPIADEVDGGVAAVYEPRIDSPKPGFTRYEFNREVWVVKNRYSDLEPLNVGAFGTVCRGWDSEQQCEVAIKRLNQPFVSAQHAKRTLREIRLLRFFNDHENLLCAIDVFTSGDSAQQMNDVYLVTVLMQADLNSLLRMEEMFVLPPDHTQFFMYQMLRGLKFLHSAGIIHRDLKPANIAVNEDSSLKIIDYGLSRAVSMDDLTGYVVTRYYRAPEIMFNFARYDESVDIWSVGCIFAEMLSGEILFPAEDHVDLLRRIVKLCGKPSMEEASEYRDTDVRTYIDSLPDAEPEFDKVFSHINGDLSLDLLKRMLVMSPRSRISVAEALKHPYFEGLHDEDDEPVAATKFQSEDFEGQDLPMSTFRDLIWAELSNAAAFNCPPPSGSGGGGDAAASPIGPS